jgi:hypothetical protein
MTYAQLLRGLRKFGVTLWEEPGSRRVIEFFLIIGVGVILTFIIMGDRPYDSKTSSLIAAVIAGILVMRMSYWNVRNKPPGEAKRSITLEGTGGFRDRCVVVASSLHYQSGWQSDRHSLHFTRGNPPIFPRFVLLRDEVWITFPNSQQDVEVKVRSWTNSKVGPTDFAVQALQEFCDELKAKVV